MILDRRRVTVWPLERFVLPQNVMQVPALTPLAHRVLSHQNAV
jgi:hypothetical protein